MRSIHTTNQQDHKNNTPYRVIHKHRTKLGNPIRSIILPVTSIITLSAMLIAGANTTYANSSVSLSVDNSDVVLELTVPSSATLNLAPSGTNNYVAFGTTDVTVSAGTNNPYGYTLTMSVPNTNLTNSSFTLNSNPNNIPLDTSNHPIIPTITSTYTDTNFPANAWGYKIGGTNYSPVPATLELASTSSAGNATTTTIELAAKVDNVLPAGSYNTTLNFNIVANVPPVLIYKHTITFNDYSFGANENCTLNVYTTFPDLLNATSDGSGLHVSPEHIPDVLYAETNQLTWVSGFGEPCDPKRERPMCAKTIVFDSKPELTIEQEYLQNYGKILFTLNGTVNGVEHNYFMAISFISDTVTLVE